ncbi:MAG: helix-turn-helix domain-containing protein [Ignavibacteriaceae bacterium]
MNFEQKLKLFLKVKFRHPGWGAAALNVSQTQLSRYLHGKTMPGGEVLIRISKLGCNMNWLLDDGSTEPMLKDDYQKVIANLKVIKEKVNEFNLEESK